MKVRSACEEYEDNEGGISGIIMFLRVLVLGCPRMKNSSTVVVIVVYRYLLVWTTSLFL